MITKIVLTNGIDSQYGRFFEISANDLMMSRAQNTTLNPKKRLTIQSFYKLVSQSETHYQYANSLFGGGIPHFFDFIPIWIIKQPVKESSAFLTHDHEIESLFKTLIFRYRPTVLYQR